MAAPRKRPTLEGIKHGVSGYKAGCGCDVCRKGNTDYMRDLRKRKARSDSGVGSVTSINRKRTESSDSVGRKASRERVPGTMEVAVVTECENLQRAKDRPTLYVSALNLARIIDDPDKAGIHMSSTKQLTAILKELHEDDVKGKATGRRKSGGRLATVGALTKVKRAQ